MRSTTGIRHSVMLTLGLLCLTGLAPTFCWPFRGQRQPPTEDKDASRQVLEDPKSNESWVEQISWFPRAYIYHNFLTGPECDGIIGSARPWMKRSSVVNANGTSGIDDIRTSYGMFIKRLESPLITAVEERLQRWTALPIAHQEDMQVLRYGVGQKYGAHYDSLDEGSPRIATVLMYLKDENLTGGETAFPVESQWIGGKDGKGAGFSDCAKNHVAAPAKRGDALLFYSLKPGGKHDHHSMHTGCPVIGGVKWTATKWIHTVPFRPETLTKDFEIDIPKKLPDFCKDEHHMCKMWADAGECEKNAEFMVGSTFVPAACPHACGLCEACKPEDLPCRDRNRVKFGFLPLSAP